MNASDLLTTLRVRGVRLTAKGDKLGYVAPGGALTPELKQALADHKAALLALLSPSGAFPRVSRLWIPAHPEWCGSLRAYADVELEPGNVLRYCRIMDWHGEYEYADLPASVLEQERIDALPEALKERIKAVVLQAWQVRQLKAQGVVA